MRLRGTGALVPACLLACLVLPSPTRAQTNGASPAARQSRDDAWWTGPMLANSAETLPPGHFLFEPYLYDIRTDHSDGFGSRSYIIYGLADRLSVGMTPTLGYTRIDNGRSSSRVGVGDLTLQAQYRLTEFHEGGWIPTTAIQLQETLPTGRYDRLGRRPADGFGSGAYATTVAINTQTYFWMPNGRILRVRFDVAQTFSRRANVHGASVYGTDTSFQGQVQPGNAFFADASFEYSLTRRWVLAVDLTYSHNHGTRVTGYHLADPPGTLPYPQNVRLDSGSSSAFGIAPAVEYSWTPAIGMLLGTRVTFGGRHTAGSVTPAMAINYVY